MALTSEQRVTKSHIAIMRSKQFCMFAGVLSVGKVNFTEDLPTAATNGRDVMYNPKFIVERIKDTGAEYKLSKKGLNYLNKGENDGINK